MTAAKHKGGPGNAFAPTDAQRSQVEAMAAYGIPQADIARVLEISVPTLVTHFREEIDTGATKANAKVAQSLFKKATGDGPQAVTAAIFWAKTRMGWRETITLAGDADNPVSFVLRLPSKAETTEAWLKQE
jgi:hypothetical protein